MKERNLPLRIFRTEIPAQIERRLPKNKPWRYKHTEQWDDSYVHVFTVKGFFGNTLVHRVTASNDWLPVFSQHKSEPVIFDYVQTRDTLSDYTKFRTMELAEHVLALYGLQTPPWKDDDKWTYPIIKDGDYFVIEVRDEHNKLAAHLFYRSNGKVYAV